MKISLNWLKDYVTPGVSTEALAHRLTMAGLEVEKIYSVNGDTVFELEITPNRPDCLNMWGMAREVSAALNKTKKIPAIKKLRLPTKKCDITIEDKQGCRRYMGTLIEKVRVAPTSEKIRKRIEAVGARAINNVVDMTNFVLLETGQPLHAFDYDKLEGGKIIVRRARKGEKIITIDEDEYELDPSILVIADARKPVAIAGIMGGKGTEVTDQTKNILLESAYFDPILIRRGSRKLGLSSDSSYRFERGVDFETVATGSKRATELILDSAGGMITKHSDVKAGTRKSTAKSVIITTSQINRLLGASLTTAQCKNILTKLDFGVAAKAKDTLKVTVPSFRGDIHNDVDLIEEIARIVGYDNLPSSLPQIKASQIPTGRRRSLRRRVQHILSAQGLNQIITYAMMNRESLKKSNQEALTGIKIQNPLTQDQEMLRPSLLSSFLSVAAFNANRGISSLSLFELGKIYTKGEERETLGVLMTGEAAHDWRQTVKRERDFYDMKGIVERLAQRLHVEGIEFSLAAEAYLEEGAAAKVSLDNTDLGVFGQVREEVLEAWKIRNKNVLFAQIDLEILFGKVGRMGQFQKLSEYPAIVRDVSLAVAKEIPFQKVRELVVKSGGQILKEVNFKEEYLGENIPDGQRGLIFSTVYQSSERTLREEDVQQVHDRLLKALETELNATIR